MAQPMSTTQFPLPGMDVETFQKGVEKGRELAILAQRRVAAWAEENPGQVILAGLALGYVMLTVVVPVSFWRAASKHPLPLRARTIYLAGSFAVAAIVLAQAILGETLVYRHGVGLSAAARAEPVVRPPASEKR